MDYLKLFSCRQLRGRILPSASKSISNRALLINALSGNAVPPVNLSDSDDTQVMLRALQEMPGQKVRQHGSRFRMVLAHHKPHLRRIPPPPGSAEPLQEA